MFQRQWFEIVDDWPRDAKAIRFWDLAATAPAPGKEPDYTAGALVIGQEGRYWIADMRRMRGTPQAVEALIKQTAELDGRNVFIRMEQEPGASGVNTIDHYARHVLAGFAFKGLRSTGSKLERARPVSSAAEAGNVMCLRGAWNAPFLEEAEMIGSSACLHDDQIDAVSGALSDLMTSGGLRAWRPGSK